MATRYNISGIQGDFIQLTLNIKDATGSAINLSGFEVRGQVRASYGSDIVILDLQPNITSNISGTIGINIPSTGSAATPVNEYVYDIERYPSGNVSGNSIKLLMGKFSILPEVTR
jgi:N-acyl-D-aspartate/D-glutamate deacylase